jgi:ATP-dependent Lhr-like helicase
MPTFPQKNAIPLILEGKNVLLIAPTGTGKTEAAFLPVFSKLIESFHRQPSIKILYITPLRSLNRDILDRLQWWCKKLDIKVAVRHGDTESKERLSQSRSPPDLLITTPETLQAILPGRNFRRYLKSIRWVIVDEVHEFAENKRGSQLSLGLERLRLITKQDFQLIGLSATIGSPEKVGRFLVGIGRDIEVVKVAVARYMKIQVVYPKPVKEDYALATTLYTTPEVAARLRVMRQYIEDHEAVLLFTNTRASAEVLTSRFKMWKEDFPISIHHGSLAKLARITAESGLKTGKLRGLICTSSLELGIDIGRIDLCLQYMSPRQVTRLVQRVGRSGHQIGQVAKGLIITMDSEDTVETMVIARRASFEDLEPIKIPNKPLDALIHQIVGLFLMWNRWDSTEIRDLFRRAYPYRKLDDDDLGNVLSYMHQRYPPLAWVSVNDKIAAKPFNSQTLYEYYYEHLSMIPESMRFLIIDDSTETAIGILDEAFVAEYGLPGNTFIIKGSTWRIESIIGDKIFVTPVDSALGVIPSWIGEAIPVPYKVANEVGQIRAFVEEKVLQGDEVAEIVSTLSKKYPASLDTIQRAISEIVEHIQRGFSVPTDRRLMIEDWDDYTILHICLGSLANRTLAVVLGYLLFEKTGYTLRIQEDPYRIIIHTRGIIDSRNVKDVLYELSTSDLKDAIRKAFEKTGLFKRRLINIARKFGAIAKGANFSNLSLDQLTNTFRGMVIFNEAIEEILNQDSDLKNLHDFVINLQKDEVEIILENGKDVTPLTRFSLKKFHNQRSLLSPEKLKQLTIESVKTRLFNEVRTFICTNCWDFLQMTSLNHLEKTVSCPKCHSDRIGVLNKPISVIKKISVKRKNKLTVREQTIVEQVNKSAALVAKYGRRAIVVLAGKSLRFSEVEKILNETERINDTLYELIVDAEQRALTHRY